jgi:hypothetical protein
MILIVAITTTAVFYGHLEVGLQKKIRGIRSVFAWASLIGMNVGGAAVTLAMIYASLTGSGVLELIASGGPSGLEENSAAMEQFIVPIAAFAGLLAPVIAAIIILVIAVAGGAWLYAKYKSSS